MMGTTIMISAKQVARRLPLLKGWMRRWEMLVSECDTLQREREALLGERNGLVEKWTALSRECAVLVSERDALIGKHVTAASEWGRLMDEYVAQRDELVQQCGALIGQRDIAAAERDAAFQRGEAIVQELRAALAAQQAETARLYGEGPPFAPNGHFYSPVVSRHELQQDAARIFKAWPRDLPGIDIREEAQLRLLKKFSVLYQDLPFGDEPRDGLRYGYKNDAYSYSDAIFFHCMLRHVEPKRVIEIGSGYSSCMLLDTSERWFGNSIACTFIEPYPHLLHTLLKRGDRERVEILPQRLQDVAPSVFSALRENDILFIDSTHVSKLGSDVNYLIFDIFPQLNPGVYIHFHDIFYPFEYPRNWAEQGRAWNESYLLHAFLKHNDAYEIVAFNTFLAHFHRKFFSEKMPLCLNNTGGSIWLRKCV